MQSGSLNKAIIIGNLGRDPELKQLEGGRAMARFNVATTERWRDGNGEMQERTDWHRIVVWGKSAEVVGEHLTKGRQVCVEGRIQTRKWQDADGKDKFMTEIVADQVTFLGAKSHRIDSDAGAAAAA
jgi:single-strand DNA-binding protein